MIYITGDTHADFRRFAKKKPFELTEKDSVIICGDFGLLWSKNDGMLDHCLKQMGGLPFKILWVGGNHENYDMIEEYNLEEWNGGKVRHIIQDKIIYLERGQVFKIEDKKIFTFGGASSHDVQGGILDPRDADYIEKCNAVRKSDLPYRVKGISWWEQELPTEEEMQEGLKNLQRVKYKVDYVISHCLSSKIQDKVEGYPSGGKSVRLYKEDILTEYFNKIEDQLEYKRWYSGHYHVNWDIDEKHTIMYQAIIPLGMNHKSAKFHERSMNVD